MKFIRDKENNEIYILDRIEITYRDTEQGYVVTSSVRSMGEFLSKFGDVDIDKLEKIAKEKNNE